MSALPRQGGESRSTIKDQLRVESDLEPTARSGRIDVLADGELVASRGGNPVTRILFGAGFPEVDALISELARRRS